MHFAATQLLAVALAGFAAAAPSPSTKRDPETVIGYRTVNKVRLLLRYYQAHFLHTHLNILTYYVCKWKQRSSTTLKRLSIRGASGTRGPELDWGST